MANEKRMIAENDVYALFDKNGMARLHVGDIDVLPRVDAVEVVRCKDCKWYRIAHLDNVPYCCHESGYCGEYMGGLFFCACGERREGE